MKIARNLNIVIPFDGGWVHSAPISRDIFELYYDELASVFDGIMSGNLKGAILHGAQISYAALKKSAKEKGNWDDVQSGLIGEISRLSNVIYKADNGYSTLPLDTAKSRDILDEDEYYDVLSSLVFFMSISRIAPKAIGSEIMKAASNLRDWQTTSLNVTDYRISLPTLTADENTGVTVNTSLVAS